MPVLSSAASAAGGSGAAAGAGGAGNMLGGLADKIPNLLQTGVGLANVLFSGRKKAERNLESLASKSPLYAGSTPVSTYYQMALNKALTSPENSAMYLGTKKLADRNTALGLSTLQGRNSALGGVASIVDSANTAALNAQMQAEAQREKNMQQLGGATELKAGDDRYTFQTNQVDPYQLKLNLAAMKAKAANERYSQGLQNLYGGLSSMSQIQNAKKVYGQ
jgi:hypothetical protein